MNLYEYVPFFGYLEEADKILGYPNYTNVRGKEELLSELLALEDDDKFGVELHNVHIQIFNALDYSCFIKIIDDLNDDERNILSILKMILNNYEENGGYPIEWLHYVLECFTSNFHHFSPLSQTYIETFLTQSLVNYERNPYRKNRLTNPHYDPDDETSYDVLSSFFLKHYDVNRLLLGLKESFTLEKGKDIRIIIEILKEYKILVIPDKKFRLFYKVLQEFFDRNIGSYTSINDYKSIQATDKEIIRIKIDDLLKRISK
jgi:hypothetical protein